MLSTIFGQFGDAETALWRRFLPLVIEGLSPERSTPLPGQALSADDLNTVMAAGGPRRER
jgi:hypothetical protein